MYSMYCFKLKEINVQNLPLAELHVNCKTMYYIYMYSTGQM